MRLLKIFKTIPEKLFQRYLKRAEKVLLEHIPEKHQKSTVAVYRAGFWLNIAGIFWSIMAIMFIFFSTKSTDEQNYVSSILIPLISLAVISFGLACLGGWIIRFKARPSQMFGIALTISVISAIIVVLVGIILVGSTFSHLEQVYGLVMMLIIDAMLTMIILFPIVLLGEFGYYLFKAHKGYLKWYEEHNRKNAKEAKLVHKTTKKSPKKQSKEENADDDLL